MTQPNCHQPSPCQLKTYIERYHERYDNERLLDKDVTYLCQSRRRAMKLNEDIVAAQDAATLVELPYGSIQPPSSTTRADTVLLLCSPYKVRLITAHAHSSPGYASQSTLFTLTFGPDIRWMGTLEVWPLTCWGKLGMAFALGRHLVLTFPLSPFPPFVFGIHRHTCDQQSVESLQATCAAGADEGRKGWKKKDCGIPFPLNEVGRAQLSRYIHCHARAVPTKAYRCLIYTARTQSSQTIFVGATVMLRANYLDVGPEHHSGAIYKVCSLSLTSLFFHCALHLP